MILNGKALLALCALQGTTAFLAPKAFTQPSGALFSEPPAGGPPAGGDALPPAGGPPPPASDALGPPTGGAPPPPPQPAGPLADVWGTAESKVLQGNTLKTWDFENPATDRVQLSARGSGRPLNANIEYWHTPSYVPMKFKVYTEDANLRPVNAVIETPKHPKSIACFNIAPHEFPFTACVTETGLGSAYEAVSTTGTPDSLQGGRVAYYDFDVNVESVQVFLKADERNMKALIELTQGPNTVKQSFEIYASSGYKTPFYAVIETPGAGNVIRIVNQNTLEFPFDVWVQPFKIGSIDPMQPTLGGGGF